MVGKHCELSSKHRLILTTIFYKNVNILSEVDRGYVAGILDGEGCIYLHPKRGYQIIITNTDKKSLKKTLDVTGIGYMYFATCNNIYKLQISRKSDVLQLLTILAPILIIKQKKARAAIKLLARSKSMRVSL